MIYFRIELALDPTITQGSGHRFFIAGIDHRHGALGGILVAGRLRAGARIHELRFTNKRSRCSKRLNDLKTVLLER